VNNVDPFIGMLAEDIIPGSDVGPTVRAILVDQFSRLRDGDRFYFGNETFNTEERTLLAQGASLADVIKNNTSITNLQANVFFNRLEISGTVFNDPDGNGVRETGEAGIPGVTIELHDAASGAFINSTMTDANGEYDFTELGAGTDGTIPATGNYTLKLILPPGFTQNATQIAHNPGEIFLSRGDLQIDGQNFAIEVAPSAPGGAGGAVGGSGGGSRVLLGGSSVIVSVPPGDLGSGDSSSSLPGTLDGGGTGDSTLIDGTGQDQATGTLTGGSSQVILPSSDSGQLPSQGSGQIVIRVPAGGDLITDLVSADASTLPDGVGSLLPGGTPPA
jgi:hypothetical protein